MLNSLLLPKTNAKFSLNLTANGQIINKLGQILPKSNPDDPFEELAKMLVNSNKAQILAVLKQYIEVREILPVISNEVAEVQSETLSTLSQEVTQPPVSSAASASEPMILPANSLQELTDRVTACDGNTDKIADILRQHRKEKLISFLKNGNALENIATLFLSVHSNSKSSGWMLDFYTHHEAKRYSRFR